MPFISVIIFASSTLTVSASMMCPESIPTVSIVPRCPSNAMEWKLAAERKKCDVLGKIQSCTEVENFMYHCVLNRDATMLLEVCAPMYYMSGYCARFSEVHKRIINDPGLDCTQFEPPCPPRFESYESYKYQICYSNRTKQLTPAPAFHHLEPRQTYQQEKDEATAAIVNTLLVIFVIIIISLIILMSVGYKRKWIEITCGKKRLKVYEENEEENERSIDEKIRDAGDCLNENRSQENSTENRENWEEKRDFIDD